jgi:hypothetical protein
LNLEVIEYLALLAILYFYLNWRESSGFLWACIYVVVLWIIEEYTSIHFGYSIVAVGTGIGITFEILSYFEKDPFSEIRLIHGFHQILRFIDLTMKKLGVQPKTSIVDPRVALDASTAIELLDHCHWDELDSYLKDLSPNDRYRVIKAMVETSGRPKVFDQWLESSSQSAIAFIVSGHQYIHWAWEARGSGLGSTVSDKNIGLFFERLFLARESLEYAIELDNQYSDSYVGLMTIAMGTGIDREHIWRYFAKALVHCKDHYEAHRSMINAVAEKWGGKPGEMFVVARQATANAKLGSHLAGIVAEAHIEQWLYLSMCDKDEEADIYFREKHVRDELRVAYGQIKDSRSETAEMTAALNNFAFCFYLADLNDLAREVIEKLNNQFAKHPWEYLGNSFMANFDPAFAIDRVLEQLSVVTTDMPDVVVQRGLSNSDAPAEQEAGNEVRINDVSDHYNRRVFKTPIVVPISVLMVILIYTGYSVMAILGESSSLLEGLKSETLILFVFFYIGLIGLIWSGRKHQIRFLDKYPAIHNEAALEEFKVIARTNMYSALLSFLFLGAGSLMAIMTIINYGWLERIVVFILIFTAGIMVNIYNGYEERMKQIECLDQGLEEELESVIDCWMNKAFPDF